MVTEILNKTCYECPGNYTSYFYCIIDGCVVLCLQWKALNSLEPCPNTRGELYFWFLLDSSTGIRFQSLYSEISSSSHLAFLIVPLTEKESCWCMSESKINWVDGSNLYFCSVTQWLFGGWIWWQQNLETRAQIRNVINNIGRDGGDTY